MNLLVLCLIGFGCFSVCSCVGHEWSVSPPQNRTDKDLKWQPVIGPKYRFMALIQGPGRDLICLGVIVSQTVVISSCRCFESYLREHEVLIVTKDLRLVVGSNYLYPNSKGYQARRFYYLRHSEQCSYHNLALIQPHLPLVFNFWVQPMPTDYISLQTAQYEAINNLTRENAKVREAFRVMQENSVKCEFVGMGTTEVGITTVLKSTEVTLVTTQVCLDLLEKCCAGDVKFEDAEGQEVSVCSAHESLLCDRDLGGALFCHGKVWAVLVHTYECGKIGDPALFVDLLTSYFNHTYQVAGRKKKSLSGKIKSEGVRERYSLLTITLIVAWVAQNI